MTFGIEGMDWVLYVHLQRKRHISKVLDLMITFEGYVVAVAQTCYIIGHGPISGQFLAKST